MTDHPHTDPEDGRSECDVCGKWVWPSIHSCKGVPVTESAKLRALDELVESARSTRPAHVTMKRWEDCAEAAALTLDGFEAVQWAPSGNPLDGVPGAVVALLADDVGHTFGYGYGKGSTMVFGSAHGDVEVQPGQWVVRGSDGSIYVSDRLPERGTTENF